MKTVTGGVAAIFVVLGAMGLLSGCQTGECSSPFDMPSIEFPMDQDRGTGLHDARIPVVVRGGAWEYTLYDKKSGVSLRHEEGLPEGRQILSFDGMDPFPPYKVVGTVHGVQDVTGETEFSLNVSGPPLQAKVEVINVTSAQGTLRIPVNKFASFTTRIKRAGQDKDWQERYTSGAAREVVDPTTGQKSWLIVSTLETNAPRVKVDVEVTLKTLDEEDKVLVTTFTTDNNIKTSARVVGNTIALHWDSLARPLTRVGGECREKNTNKFVVAQEVAVNNGQTSGDVTVSGVVPGTYSCRAKGESDKNRREAGTKIEVTVP